MTNLTKPATDAEIAWYERISKPEVGVLRLGFSSLRSLLARLREAERTWYDHRCEHSPIVRDQDKRIAALEEAAREVLDKCLSEGWFAGSASETLAKEYFVKRLAEALEVPHE